VEVADPGPPEVLEGLLFLVLMGLSSSLLRLALPSGLFFQRWCSADCRRRCCGWRYLVDYFCN
jgi:hypothetical protein